MTATPALADGPPVTLTLSAVDLASGAPVTEVESGKDFTYTASVGCPDPNGCGPATLEVTFPDLVEFVAGGFNAPAGATYDFVPASQEPNAPGGTLSVSWDPLGGTAVVFLPVRVSPMVDASNNGSSQLATSILRAGDETQLERDATVTLRAYEHPGVGSESASWADSALQDGTQASTSMTLTGVAAANAPSSLTFRLPGSEAIPGATLPVAEAFDLTGLALNQNPHGARITFTLADGSTDIRTLDAPNTTVTAPDSAVDYEITVFGLPSLESADEAARTVTATAAYTLRDTQRSGGRIIDPAFASRQVRATATVTNTVSDAAPGEAATHSKPVRANIEVRALLPEIDHSMAWTTASGDATSVYESGEASTVTAKVWNSGASVLRDLAISLPHLNAKYFEFQELTSVPDVKFPAGATTATIQYSYKSPLTPGEPHQFSPGDAVPGPDADGPDHELGQITGVAVVFTAAEGQVIDGKCDSADLCAAQLILHSVLRDTQLTSGAAISPPASNPGDTTVGVIGRVIATGASGSILRQDTTQATLKIVKPQFKATLSKRFGDGTDEAVYPLTGVAKTGDHFDPSLPEGSDQAFADHALRFVAATTATEGATEQPGARELSISDPQTAPEISRLGSGPFDAIKFTALSPADAVCTTPDDEIVGSSTQQEVWVLDSLTDPTTVTLLPLDASTDLELVVGVKLSITPTDASGRFPVDVSCVSAEGTTVKFRHARVSDGTIVSPENLSQEATPGLYTLVNTAELVTGKNTVTAVGGDSMYLVDLLRASVYKHFAKGAKGYGVQGEESPTSFLLSGVPASEGSTATRVADGLVSGSTMTSGQSFDVFKLAGVREARVGPDQTMKISFLDRTGTPIGPVGEVEASIALESRDLTSEEIEDSQSEAYLEFQRTPRDVNWSAEWADGDMAKVAGVQFEVTRADTAEKLQRFGAFSLVIDTTLRSHLLSSPATAITGAPSGEVYLNMASITSLEGADPGEWLPPITSSLKFRVFAATALFAHAETTWSDANVSADRYLVAKHQTPSKIVMNAENRTAVGVSGEPNDPEPEDQWSLTGSIAVGVESLSVGVAGAPESGRNPFAITEFAGITEMTWPVRNEALKDEPNTERRVAGSITYILADGTSIEVAAPVGAAIADLNPPKSEWGDVVGVTATWSEAGKFVGITRPNAANTGRLAFQADLLDYVRDGYSYEFVAGDPKTLSPGASIDGALQDVPEVVDQFATLDADFSATLAGFDPAAGAAESGTVLIDVAKRSVSVGVGASGPTLYRDIRTPAAQADTTWTISNTNTSNIPVSGLWLATDKALLDRAHWPQSTPGDYEFPAGSALDSFDIVKASLVFPVGAASASVWAVGTDGVWTNAIPLTNAGGVSLPSSGPGPKSWGAVTGVRVQFESNEVDRKRIQKGAVGSLVLGTKLRETLRSDPSEIAPARVVPEGAGPAAGEGWVVSMDAAGTAHVGTPGTELEPYNDAAATRTILAGAPRPFTGKFTANFDPSKPLPPTSVQGNPGSWVNFYVVLRNNTNATSNLYDLSAIDTLPGGLRYNAVNAQSEWKVLFAPERLAKPEFAVSSESPATTLRWDWRVTDYLKPGEHVVIRVPLQLSDGFPAGSTATNLARLVGNGIEGVTVPSVCASETGSASACTAQAYVSSLRNDSVRAESYIDASVGGSSTLIREACDATTIADWADGTWVRNPCIAETTSGGTLKYRLKLINSGNMDLSEMRFVDELPKLNDKGTVLDSARGSEWTPSLLPDSVRLLVGDEATDLGARGDGEVSQAGFRYSPTAKPCSLSPDAESGKDTLECAASSAAWSADPSTESQAFGGDIVFNPDAKLAGGEYVIVEFDMAVPATDDTAELAWNTAAVSARAHATSLWLPASESPRSGARTQDTSMTIALALEDAPVTSWHLDAKEFALTVSCLSPGASEPVLTTARFDDSVAGPYPKELTVSGLPRGGICEVVDEHYTPSSPTASGQYGTVSDGVTGFSFTTEPAEPIVLDGDAANNVLTVTNSFAEATLEIGVEIEGSASEMIPADAEFTVDVSCSFGGTERNLGPMKVTAGGSNTIDGLPVGAVCRVAETDHRGASAVSATLGGSAVPLDEGRSLTLEPVDPGTHEVVFVNAFEAGGVLSVLKRVELPGAGLAVGDVEFLVNCSLGGYPLDLGDRGTLRHTFAAGETETLLPVPGIPAGASCTVSETVTGGADVPAPDRTATVLPDDEVIVEMVNTFEPAVLELSKEITGPGATEQRVPATFTIDATCTRELTIGGTPKTVTDFAGSFAVAPGEPHAITGLPSGSSCAVGEPDLGGAEFAEITSLTADAPDEDPAADTALVSLVGPGTDGEAVPTRVQVRNHFSATEQLGVTGGQSWLLAGGVAVLLLGLGAVMVSRRRS
ncbi:hypothetical protein ACI1US_01901 [Leucobacter sp. BZR 635]